MTYGRWIALLGAAFLLQPDAAALAQSRPSVGGPSAQDQSAPRLRPRPYLRPAANQTGQPPRTMRPDFGSNAAEQPRSPRRMRPNFGSNATGTSQPPRTLRPDFGPNAGSQPQQQPMRPMRPDFGSNAPPSGRAMPMTDTAPRSRMSGQIPAHLRGAPPPMRPAERGVPAASTAPAAPPALGALAAVNPQTDAVLVNKNAAELPVAFLDGGNWSRLQVPAQGVAIVRCTQPCGDTIALEFNDSVEQKRYMVKVGGFYVLDSSADRGRWVFQSGQ